MVVGFAARHIVKRFARGLFSKGGRSARLARRTGRQSSARQARVGSGRAGKRAFNKRGRKVPLVAYSGGSNTYRTIGGGIDAQGKRMKRPKQKRHVSLSGLNNLPMQSYLIDGYTPRGSLKGKQGVYNNSFFDQVDLNAISAGDTQIDEDKEVFYLMNGSRQFMITNASNSTAILTCYWCKCIRSTSTGPIADWDAGMADVQVDANWNSNRIFTKPNQSRVFNERWKINKVKKYTLGAGGMITLVDKWMHKPKRVSRTLWANELYVSGLTQTMLFVVHGIPLNDAGTVGFGESQLNIAFNGYYGYKILKDNVPKVKNISAPPVLAAPMVVTTDADEVSAFAKS